MTFRHEIVLSPLGRFVPFFFRQDDYDDGVQTLYVWRWGRLSIEKWYWPGERHELYYKLKDVLPRKHLYAAVTKLARRL